jgi:hypothetical protein
LPFIGSIVLLLLGTFLAFRMKPGEELAVPGRRAYGEATA